MKLIKYFSILFSVLFIASCSGDPEDFFSPVVDIELPPHKSKLVVFANFDADSDSLVVHLTRSRSALDTASARTTIFDTTRFPNGGFFVNQYQVDYTVLKNAKVELFRNEVLWGTFQIDKIGKYTLKKKLPNDGANYRLRAEVAGYDVVEATQKMPASGVLDSVRFVKDAVIVQDPFGNGTYKEDEFTYFIKDPIETGNYYRVERPRFYDRVTNTNSPSTLYIESSDKLSQSEFLSDKSFNGKTYNWRHQGKNYNALQRGSRMEYTLLTTTSELLQFVRSKELNENARDNPFAEPVILYSNIKNGYGIFSLTTSSTWIKKY
jgi:Domain of unknown function (DUF4249)